MSVVKNLVWNGPIQVLNCPRRMVRAVDKILQGQETHLGFDVEYVQPHRHQLPALVQIATSSSVYLFRFRVEDEVRDLDPILPLLTSGDLKKTGVNVNGDVSQLLAMQSFDHEGFQDITSVTRHLGIEQCGLNCLAKRFMGGRKARRPPKAGSWDSLELSKARISYAATDAWLSRELFRRAVVLDPRLARIYLNGNR